MSILYRAEATSTGGRTGTSKTSDGRLSVTLDTVKELGGAGGDGTNPSSCSRRATRPAFSVR